MNHSIIYYLLLVCMLFASCKKDENKPQPDDLNRWFYTDQQQLEVVNTPDINATIKLDLPVKMVGENNIQSTLYFEADTQEVVKYNKLNNTHYQLLPTACFDIQTKKLEIETNIKSATGVVIISPQKIAKMGGYKNEKYLLPVKLTSEGISVKENQAYFYFSFIIDSLIFEDDFNGSESMPNPDFWSLCTKGTSDWNRYLSASYDQTYVNNGNLVLKTEQINGKYVTGGVETKDKFFFQYGKVSVRARFTKLVQGGWPAIWLMPQVPKYSGGWPNGGEIDIMEHLNKETFVHHAVHSYYTKNNNDNHEGSSEINLGDYNIYELEWNENKLIYSVNGNVGFSYKNEYFADDVKKQWPFDAPFYVILNNSLGGLGTWPGEITNSELPGTFEIDWIRITQ